MASETKGGLSETIVINTGVETIKKTLLDFETYPEWMSGVVNIEVLKRDRSKRGTQVKYTVDAIYRKLNYVLEYSYKKDRIDIHYVEGDLDDVEAYYEFAPLSEDETEVTYYYRVSYSLPKALRGPMFSRLLKQVDKKVMKSALEDLKKRAESLV
ncbi:MAG: SRPBCC family protein [Actinomycetota bacterium]|nr:SRPBCC family protein [Actinomycetota bacterium]